MNCIEFVMIKSQLIAGGESSASPASGDAGPQCSHQHITSRANSEKR